MATVEIVISDDDMARILCRQDEPRAFIECAIRDRLDGAPAAAPQPQSAPDPNAIALITILTRQRNRAMDELARAEAMRLVSEQTAAQIMKESANAG